MNSGANGCDGELSGALPVSVIIPAYNAAGWIERAVLSLVQEPSSSPSEILVINDGSTDSTADVVLRLALQYPCIRLLSHDERRGIGPTRFTGIEAATNDWVSLLDSDDYLEVGAIAAALDSAVAADADLCIFELWKDAGGALSLQVRTDKIPFPIDGRAAARLTLLNWGMHAHGVIRKSRYEAAYADASIRSFNADELVTSNADELVTRQVLLRSERITSCSKRYYYVTNPQSSTQSGTADKNGPVRAERWLLDFARTEGFLRAEPRLAVQMIGRGVAVAEQLLSECAGWDEIARRQRAYGDVDALRRSIARSSWYQWTLSPRAVRGALRNRRRVRRLAARLRALRGRSGFPSA